MKQYIRRMQGEWVAPSRMEEILSDVKADQKELEANVRKAKELVLPDLKKEIEELYDDLPDSPMKEDAGIVLMFLKTNEELIACEYPAPPPDWRPKVTVETGNATPDRALDYLEQIRDPVERSRRVQEVYAKGLVSAYLLQKRMFCPVDDRETVQK